VSWHVPNADEIDFSIQIFREVVEPMLEDLEKLLQPGVKRNNVWRNDFCRYLNFVRMAFSGTPTIVQEIFTKEDQAYAAASSDIQCAKAVADFQRTCADVLHAGTKSQR
jgi:proteasome activator subunit 4